MKTVKLLAVLLLFSSAFFINCTPDNDRIGSTKDIIIRGRWAIDYFNNGQDKTADFAIYYLTFYANGTVICACDNDVFEGTYKLQQDGNRNDILLLQLPYQQPDLQQLCLDWRITEKELTRINMKKDASQPAQLLLRRL